MCFKLCLSLFVAPAAILAQTCTCDASLAVGDSTFTKRVVVTNEAKGARCAVAADFDGDGLNDLVSASSTDNTVAWYRNLGDGAWSGKQDITYLSNGARIVTTGDVDADGDDDVIAASYYDDTIRWFENDLDKDGSSRGFKKTHIITTTAVNAQGVHAADLDGDGDLDLVSASSGDNTVAVYINVDRGRFCEIKRLVDTNAVGVRTVVSGDFDGDGSLDLASASKDDNIVAWYPNDGDANFNQKIVISNTSIGAYSLVARDLDKDGNMDLIVASNGDDTVAFWRNSGGSSPTFTKTVIYASADFVLSVTAFDFDRDGDLDVASASFFDGYVRWYENLDGAGTSWLNHTLYVGSQGHYVSTSDLDGDGDEDLVSVTHSENRIQVFYASTECDSGGGADQGSGSGETIGGDAAGTAACCALGSSWNGTVCIGCAAGTYGTFDAVSSTHICTACPSTCTIAGLSAVPATCSGFTGCPDADASATACDCPLNHFKSNVSDTCSGCPAGQSKTATGTRPLESLGAPVLWVGLLNTCEVESVADLTPVWASILGVIAFLILAYCVYRLTNRFNAALKAQSAYEAWIEGQIDCALSDISKVRFSVCFLPFSAIKRAGKLTDHEACRASGNLLFFDTFAQVIDFVHKTPTAFFSHQWLAKDEPDPDNQHYEALIKAANALCEKESIDPDELYCWLDYSSIPQANDEMKMLSVSSIAIYASVCRFFVALCPTITLKHSGAVVDVSSYQKRGWCRLEQWARLTVGGLQKMFIYIEGSEIKDLSENPAWYQDAIRVLNGDFTDERDKPKLVPMILGLWAAVLRNRRNGDDSVGVYELVKFAKQEVFPPEYFGSMLDRLEARLEAEEEEKKPDEIEEEDTKSTKSVSISGDSATSKESSLRRTIKRMGTKTLKRTDGDLFRAFKASQGGRVSTRISEVVLSSNTPPQSPKLTATNTK